MACGSSSGGLHLFPLAEGLRFRLVSAMSFHIVDILSQKGKKSRLISHFFGRFPGKSQIVCPGNRKPAEPAAADSAEVSESDFLLQPAAHFLPAFLAHGEGAFALHGALFTAVKAFGKHEKTAEAMKRFDELF